MNQQELEADLARLESYKTGQTKFVVWDIQKLLWIYKQLLEKNNPPTT